MIGQAIVMESEPAAQIEYRIRQRAYLLWEAEGKQDGRADEYWQRARNEIQDEAKSTPIAEGSYAGGRERAQLSVGSSEERALDKARAFAIEKLREKLGREPAADEVDVYAQDIMAIRSGSSSRARIKHGR